MIVILLKEVKRDMGSDGMFEVGIELNSQVV